MGLTAEEALGASRGYTDQSIAGGGAIKGKNCTIDDIEDITGGHRVTFKWTLDDGTVQTDTMDVMDGAKGDTGPQGPKGEKGDTGDAGDYGNLTNKPSINNVTLSGNKSLSDLGVPSKTSDLTNDSGFITNLVNNLLNYYLKTETYSKTEVDALLQAITTLDIQAVNTLPTTNISTTTIYLVPKQDPQVPDVKDEYINLDGTTSGWELIGNTQIDLSNYVTTSDLTTALQSYATKAYVNGLTFVGTQAQWNALTTAQKKAYKFADITDDYSDNPVGNLNALTTTDKSSCVGAINELNAYHTRHYGTPVDITSASSSDLYTCPSDGFITAETNNASNSSTVNVIDYDLNVVLIASGGTGGMHQIRNGCNVIKGQRIYNNITEAPGAKVRFIPLVNS